MQSDDVGHETPLRWLRDDEPVELGLATVVQLVPFQSSVNVVSAKFEVEKVTEAPTAMQLAPDEHDTPTSEVSVDPLGFGVDAIDQLVPFQCSARAFWDVDVEENPTAAQSVSLAQDTPLNAVSSDPVGLAEATIDQVVPFQRSINPVIIEFDAFVERPTAKQSVADEHDNPLKEDSNAPTGLGVATSTQLVPFQCSANVASSDVPTALQSITLGHNTCNSSLCDVCETSGVTDQRVPSQCSTDAEFPTAAQLTELGHETPVRPRAPPNPPNMLNAAGRGSAGLAAIDQLAPFHCSTSSLSAIPVALVA